MRNIRKFNYRIRKLPAIIFTIALLGLLFSGCSAKPRVYRVGILSGVEALLPVVDGFKKKMTELGYIEGKNIVYDLQKLNDDRAGEQRVAKKFVVDKVDLILVYTTEATLAVKAANEGTNIPVVFASVGIEGTNLVESVRQPGGNITGVRLPAPEMTVKRFELLLELMPKTRRVWTCYGKNYPLIPCVLEALRPAASSRGVALVEVPISTVEDIQADLQRRTKSNDIGMDAILILPELLTQSPDGWATISKFAAEHNVPIVASIPFEIYQPQGAVFTYGPDDFEIGSFAAPLADKILKGTPAGTIPVISPESHLRINYKRALELGLKVNEGLLSRAREIIR